MSKTTDHIIQEGSQQAAYQDLVAANEALSQQLETAHATIKSLTEVVYTLDAQVKELEAAPAITTAAPTFTVGKQAFQVIHGVRAMSDQNLLTTYTAADVAANKDLREALVKAGSSAVAKI